GAVTARGAALRAWRVERVAQDGRQQVARVGQLRAHGRRRRRAGGRVPGRGRLHGARIVDEQAGAVAVLREAVLRVGQEPAVVGEVDEDRVCIHRGGGGGPPH